jgi:tetratricopeptide (TPR) repeat protein
MVRSMNANRSQDSSGQVSRSAGTVDGLTVDPVRTSSPVRIAVTGNCQSMFLASVMNALPGVTAEYFGKQGRHIPFEGVSAATHRDAELNGKLREWKEAGSRVLLAEQVWPLAPQIDLDALGGVVDDVVRFPNFEAFALWPNKKYPPNQVARLTPERMLRLDKANIAASSSKATVTFTDIIDDSFKDVLLFDTPRHPSPKFFSVIVERLLSSKAFEGIDFDLADMARRVGSSRGINTVVAHPVERRIVEALQCSWAETPVYRHWRVILEQPVAAPPGVVIKLIDELFSLRDTDPDFYSLMAPAIWNRYAWALARSGDKEGSDRARGEAIKADPHNPRWRTILVRDLRREKRFDEARRAVLDYLALVPGSGAFREMLGHLDMDEGYPARAREHYEAAVRLSPVLPGPRGHLAALDIDAAIQALKSAHDAIQSSPHAIAKWGENRQVLRESMKHLSSLADTMRQS